MDQDEGNIPWSPDAYVHEITRFFPNPIAKKLQSLRDIEGVEDWTDLHLHPGSRGETRFNERSRYIHEEGESFS
jgi:hypothetical protein